LSECINGLLAHHGKYARSLRGRGHIPPMEIVRYLERRFSQPLHLLGKQQYPILETATFANGLLDCNDILTLNKVVRGEQLEEFYWEAVQGLAAFLRMIFAVLLNDEVGNSHTGRQLNVAWKIFLSEIDHEVQQYQVYRAHRTTQATRSRDSSQVNTPGMTPNWNSTPGPGGDYWSRETQRRSI
jgi:predicted DNA-binding ribbon-helix-helix protein